MLERAFIMLERAPGVSGLTLADSIPSLHCGLPADFLNCFRAIDNVLTCFSLFCKHFVLQAAFLPYCIEKGKRLGLILHIFSFYTFILEWSASKPDSQNHRSAVKGFKLCIFNTTMKSFNNILCVHSMRDCFMSCWHKL